MILHVLVHIIIVSKLLTAKWSIFTNMMIPGAITYEHHQEGHPYNFFPNVGLSIYMYVHVCI